jgi:hypothetical protein
VDPAWRARAPEPTVPGPRVEDGLLERFSVLDELLTRLEPELPAIHVNDCTTEHPILGHFTPARWLRFLDIHHRHHEKIIKDILAAAGR